MRILVATKNQGKLREYQRLLAGVPGLELETMASAGVDVDVDEDRDTFEGNARKKASEIAGAAGLPCLADDSGLEVDALGGRPGVYSARYSGEDATDESNNEKLLEELGQTPDEGRTARFVCVIAVVDADGRELAIASGACEGRIGHTLRGAHGFGYDPLFIPDGYAETMAELGPDTKNRISHRAKAAAKLGPLLRQLPTK
jgi:XTP/dITP diphosphohydrolase